MLPCLSCARYVLKNLDLVKIIVDTFKTIQGLRLQAEQLRYRLPLCISGSRQWCHEQAAILANDYAQDRCLCLGELQIPGINSVTISSAFQYLGHEWDMIIFDAWSGLDPDALAAIAGTITAGGMLLLLCPPLDEWPDYADPEYVRIAVHPYDPRSLRGHYLHYFVQQLQHSTDICLWQERNGLSAFAFTTNQAATDDMAAQQQAIAAIEHVAHGHGHAHRPALLIADRGRGKSAAMGMAAAQLLQQDIKQITVTAPRPAAAETLLRHAQDKLPNAERHGHSIRWQDKTIDYMAADELLRHPRQTSLLLVDEAAALPTHMLRGLLRQYPRIAFATTVHGYEGTGRAFRLRFEKELQAGSEGYQRIELQQPIRYAADDPLERFLFQTLLLDVELPSRPQAVDQWQFMEQNIQTLVNAPQRLRDSYALLNMAHYRTRPYDLRHLLDGPNIRLFTLQEGDELLGVVMVAMEAIDEQGLHGDIINGTRRPRGHLIPQSLASHSGWHEALRYRYARIIRIAVHPDLQGQGLGSAILDSLRQRLSGVDFLAASFGATSELLQFWQRNGFVPVRLGFHQETNSGLHALMMLRPLHDESAKQCRHWQARLQQQLPLLTRDVFAEVDEGVLQGILEQAIAETDATGDDRRDVDDFIAGRRQYEACILGLQRLMQQHPTADTLILDKLLRGMGWAELAQKHQLAGRRASEAALRKAVALWRNSLQ